MKTINKKLVFKVICEANKVLHPKKDEIAKIIAQNAMMETLNNYSAPDIQISEEEYIMIQEITKELNIAV